MLFRSLKSFLELPNGIPSHDTFRRVLMLIDPEAFERCFLAWVREVFRSETTIMAEQIAIDGKTMRRSFDRRRGGCTGRSKIGPRGGGNLGHCGGRSLTLPRSKNREKRNPYARFGGPMNSIRGH